MNDKTTLNPPSTLAPWHWGWAASIAAIVVVTAAFRYALPIRDGDIWFHMLYGRYFLEFETLIADHTIFSWSPSTNDNIYCTWIPDIFLFLLYKISGLPGFFAFQYLCLAVLPFGCYFHARRLGIVTHPVVWLLCLLAVIMSYTAIFAKPEIFSFVFMSLAAWNWWYIRSGGVHALKNCYFFPVIMLLWVNCHGAFFIGCLFFCTIGIGELLNVFLSPDRALSLSVRKHLFCALILSCAAVFLTPYGYSYPLYLLKVLIPTSENLEAIKGVASFDTTFGEGEIYNLTMAANVSILILAILMFRNLKQVDWTTVLANLLFAFLFTRMYRTTFYWPPVLLYSGINMLALNSMVPEGWRRAVELNKAIPVLVLSVTVLLAGSTLYKAITTPEKWLWMGFGISELMPVSEARYIKTYFPKARICNTYNQGSYLLWELWPENKVFLDGRHFPYRDWLGDYLALVNDPKKNRINFSKKYPCDIWCIDLINVELVLALLDSEEWRLAFYGKSAAVLVRKDIPLPRPAFLAEKEIYNVRSTATITNLFRFMIGIGDWDTTEKLLSTVQQQLGKHKWQENRLQWFSHYVAGLKAYKEKNYLQAASLLAHVDNTDLDNIREIQANALLFLAKSAWDKGDATLTWRLLSTAQQLERGKRLSLLYNLGVVEWWQVKGSKNSNDSGDQSLVAADTESWHLRLAEYLRREKAAGQIDIFRQTAVAIMAGSQIIRPDLLVPAEPGNRRYLAEWQ